MHARADVPRRVDRAQPLHAEREKIAARQRLPQRESIRPDRVHDHADRVAAEEDEAELQKIAARSVEQEKHERARKQQPPDRVRHEKRRNRRDHPVERRLDDVHRLRRHRPHLQHAEVQEVRRQVQEPQRIAVCANVADRVAHRLPDRCEAFDGCISRFLLQIDILHGCRCMFWMTECIHEIWNSFSSESYFLILSHFHFTCSISKRSVSHRKALLFKFHVDISTRYFITQVSRGSSQLAANCALYRLA